MLLSTSVALTTPHVLYDSPTTAADVRLLQHDHVIPHLELDLRMRQQPESLANLLRDGDLALGGDFH